MIVTRTSTAITSPIVTPSSDTTEPSEPNASSGGQQGGDNSSDNKDNDGDDDTAQRNRIIIGVCVGVGGAILMGAVIVLLLKLKRNKANPIDEDDLMRRDGSPLADAGRKEGTESSPFQATLDQYHRPGPVNAASNF